MITLPLILIHEYVSGGGWPEADLPTDLADEGLAMLQAVLADFQAWGGCETVTTRDHRLAHIPLPADHIINLEPEQHYSTLSQLAGQCTAALIIAPESNGILADLSTLMQRRGARLLGSCPASISVAANKWRCHQLFTDAGLPTPATFCVKPHNAMEVAEKIGFPLIIKPIDGVGCADVALITDSSSLGFALSQARSLADAFLFQQYIQGDPASVSLLMTGSDTRCLSLNRQAITVGPSFSYTGGEVPFACDRREEAICLAKQAVALVPGLKGYIGVDLVITDYGCYLIEINPRITVAYIGLRRVVNINLAQAIWTTAVQSVLPEKIFLLGKAVFRIKQLI